MANPAPQQIGRPVFSSGRRNPQLGDIYELEDSASSTYNGLSLTLNRRMFDELEFSASYTLSKALDNASDFDEQPQNPFDFGAERGFSRQDQRHLLVFNGLWELPIGDDEDSPQKKAGPPSWPVRVFGHIQLAPIVPVGSGRVANPLTGVDSNRSHAFPLSSRPLALGRNSVRAPWLADRGFSGAQVFSVRKNGAPGRGGGTLQSFQPSQCQRRSIRFRIESCADGQLRPADRGNGRATNRVFTRL